MIQTVPLKQIVDATFILLTGLVTRMDSVQADDSRNFMLSTTRRIDHEALTYEMLFFPEHQLKGVWI